MSSAKKREFYILRLKCCQKSNDINLGYTKEEDFRSDYCLECNTQDPETEIITY